MKLLELGIFWPSEKFIFGNVLKYGGLFGGGTVCEKGGVDVFCHYVIFRNEMPKTFGMKKNTKKLKKMNFHPLAKS